MNQVPNQQSSPCKKYYAISEIARIFNVSTSLIRFWEKEFPSLRPAKNKQGIRKYTQANIAQIRKIYHLVKEQGYTLQGAKRALKHNPNKLTTNTEIVHMLKELRGLLVMLRAQL